MKRNLKIITLLLLVFLFSGCGWNDVQNEYKDLLKEGVSCSYTTIQKSTEEDYYKLNSIELSSDYDGLYVDVGNGRNIILNENGINNVVSENNYKFDFNDKFIKEYLNSYKEKNACPEKISITKDKQIVKLECDNCVTYTLKKSSDNKNYIALLDSKNSNENNVFIKKTGNIVTNNYNLFFSSTTKSGFNYDNVCLNSSVLGAFIILGNILKVIKWIVPLIIIVLGMVDFVKATLSNDDNAIKKATSSLSRRIIAGLIIFFVPTIIGYITKSMLDFDVFNKESSFISCTDSLFHPEDYVDIMNELKQKEENEKNNTSNEDENNTSNEDDTSNGGGNNISSEEIISNIEDRLSKVSQYKNIDNNLYVGLYRGFSYWIYFPKKVTTNLPIIAYLPGLGEQGNDYFGGKVGIYSGPISESYKNGYSYNAILVNLQVPKGKSSTQYNSLYIELLDKIASEFGANKSKISVIGLSHGCYGVVSLINENPRFFSAAVPVGCAPNKKNDLKNFIYQPIWTFLGSGDGESDYVDEYGKHYSLQNFVDGINALGGNAKHTVAPKKAHNIMNVYYSILRDENYDLINWMISQTKK